VNVAPGKDRLTDPSDFLVVAAVLGVRFTTLVSHNG